MLWSGVFVCLVNMLTSCVNVTWQRELRRRQPYLQIVYLQTDVGYSAVGRN